MQVARTFETQLAGELIENQSLARYTSWRVGGCADVFYRPASVEDLSLFLASWPASEPVFYLGLGSNVLIRDGGIRGAVILLHGLNATAERLSGLQLRAGAGMSCAKVARFAAAENLLGASFLAGIPGTMGGALAMNAGAFGGETWPVVASVTTMTRFGDLCQRTPEEFEIGYRSVVGIGDDVFIDAVLQLDGGDGDIERAAIRKLLDRRAATQPTGVPSCGSVFRNPQGDHAARLIEAAGLKGRRIGGAEVSEKHANFIINTGDATAADLEALIALVHETVLQTFDVDLHREVRMVGEE